MIESLGVTVSSFEPQIQPVCHDHPRQGRAALCFHRDLFGGAAVDQTNCDLVHISYAKRRGKRGVHSNYQRGSVMPFIFDLLYHEYCRARLAEMRKQLFLIRYWNATSKELCDDASPSTAASGMSTIEGRADCASASLDCRL